MSEVAAGQSSPNRHQQAIREEPNEEFEEVVLLGVQGGEITLGYLDVPRDGEHANERYAYGVVVPINLGQDLERSPWYGEEADDLSRLESLMSASQNGRVW